MEWQHIKSSFCVTGKNFAQYLPMVMEPVMRTAAMKPEVALLDNDDLETIEGSLDWHFIPLGDQQNFGIKTAGKLQHMRNCVICSALSLTLPGLESAHHLREHFVS